MSMASARDLQDDTVGPHPQAVLDQLSLADFAFASMFGGRVSTHVVLLKLELCRVLDHDDALAIGNEGREHVEQGGLS